MNAYELADRLFKANFKESANMIIQQAERIKELEKECNWAKDQWNKDRICFEASKTELEKDLALKTRDRDVFREFTLAYEKRIAELEKSDEPIAWTNQKWLDGIAKEPQLFQPLFVHGKQTEHNTIPLYTTPQIKELSDAEISEISHRYHYTYNPDYVGFARAILKKASEK